MEILKKSLAFDNIVSHADALDCWSQYYDQLTPGDFRGHLQDMQWPGLRIFRERMNCRVAQHTYAPAGTVNLLIPVQMQTSAETTSPQTLPLDRLILFPLASEFFFCTPSQADYAVVSLDQAYLERLLVPEDLDTFLHRPHGYALRCKAATLASLGMWCVRLLEVAGADSDAVHKTVLHGSIREEITRRLLEGLDGASDLAGHSRRNSRICTLETSHHYLVRYCHERALADAESTSVLGLCKELHVPRRTLAYAFKRTTGISLNQFLRAVRLNAADRSLRRQPELSLGDIAHQWGFAHASHFGREYKRLFGRTPSYNRQQDGVRPSRPD